MDNYILGVFEKHLVPTGKQKFLTPQMEIMAGNGLILKSDIVLMPNIYFVTI